MHSTKNILSILACIILCSAALTSSLSLHAQPGWWTWMTGSSTANSTGSFGMKGVPSPSNVPPAVYEPVEWTDTDGNFWLFGGSTATGGRYSALWKFDPATNLWTWMNGDSTTGSTGIYGTQGIPDPANKPGARGFGALSWVDMQGNLWLFGGSGFHSTGMTTSLGDLWKYDISTNMWTWMKGANTGNAPGSYGTQGVPAASNEPPGRAETSACWTDNTGNLWMFGGQRNGGVLNDLWKYDINTNAWTWVRGSNTLNSAGSYGTKGVPSPANDPPSRFVYSRWKDPDGNLWMFGGRGSSSTDHFNDLWKYDIAADMWTWINGSNSPNDAGSYGNLCVCHPANVPPARFENRTCWTDASGNFWMFGGSMDDQAGLNLNDLWHYNIQSGQWAWVSGSNTANSPGSYGSIGIPAQGNIPLSRMGAVPFIDTAGNFWLFGGFDQNYNGRNDLWRFMPDSSCIASCVILPLADYSADTLGGCAPLTVNFSNLSQNATSWLWDFGDGTTSNAEDTSHSFSNPGTYTVSLIAYNGSGSDTLIKTNYISVFPSPTIEISGPDTICLGQNASFTANGTGAFLWNTGDTAASIVVSPFATAEYIATVSNGNCSASDTVTLYVLQYPEIIFSGDTDICEGENSILTASGGISYQWNTGSATDTVTVAPISSAIFYVTVSNGSCDAYDSISVSVGLLPSVTIAGDPGVCLGENVILSANASNADSIIWSNGGTSTDISVSPSSDSSFWVMVTNSCGNDGDTLPVVVHPLPVINAGADTTIFYGTPAQLTATGGAAYSWSPADGLSCTSCPSPVASPESSTAYSLSVTDVNGCMGSDEVIISVDNSSFIYVANIFSPNSDGVNDVLHVKGLGIESLRFVVFNRWGERVFETTDLSLGWDGSFRGKMLNPAVFAYSLEVVFMDGSEYREKGDITLIR